MLFFFAAFAAFSVQDYISVFVTILIGVILSTSRTGSGIDMTNKVMFKYYNFLGYKNIAKKFPLKNYSCILKLRNRTVQINHTIINESTRKEGGLAIYLANQQHTKKYELKLCPSSKEAEKFADELSVLLSFPIEKYSPPVRAKRRR